MHEIAGQKPSPESIMIAEYPKLDAERLCENVEAHMDSLQQVCYHIRNIRGELGIAPGEALDVIFRITQPDAKTLLQTHLSALKSLLNLSENIALGSADQAMPKAASTAAVPGIEIAVVWTEDVRRREIERLQKILAKAEQEIISRTVKLQNEKFVSRAPDHVIQKEKDALQTAQDEKEMVSKRLEGLKNVS